MEIPAELIAAFPPAADLLLDRSRREIDDAMLMYMARADYSRMADEMFAELRTIRDKGIVPAPMDLQLAEVLGLTRWCNPEEPDVPPFAPGPTGRPGHQIRLFVCAVLLRAAAEPANANIDSGSDDSTLAQCLTSANVLGLEMSEAVARFLTWRIPHLVDCSEPLLFALGLLICALRLRSGRFEDSVLGKIAEWLIAEDARLRQEFPWEFTNPVQIAFSVEKGLWQSLATELKSAAAAIRSDDARFNLQLWELLVEPGSIC